MKHTLSRKLRYHFEQFMAKGGSSIFISLLIVFLVCFALIIGIRLLLIWIFGDSVDPVSQGNTRGILDEVYDVWLQMTDPGNMNQDIYSGPWVKVAAVLAGFVGVIIFSALIAFITTALDNLLYEFRKGRGPILESEHTLILGWNERVVDIIRELIIANESEKSASVVVLSSEDKEKMDDFITKRLPNTETTKIVTTNGNHSNINELYRVNAQDAKSIIILSSGSDMAEYDEKLLSDTVAIKTIMAMITLQNGKNQLPIIAEILTEQKRKIVEFFDDENIIALDSWDIMGKLLVQTSLTSGLEMVYNEILSFDLNEVYFYHSNWKGIQFGELPYHFVDGIPLGIHSSDGTLTLRPPNETVLKDDDEILILADDNSTIDFKEEQLYKPNEIIYEHKALKKETKRTLVLGWHHIGNIFIRECDDYLMEGSEFDVMMQYPTDEIKNHIQEIDAEYPDLKITLFEENTLSIENLKNLKPFDYDNIIILSQNPNERSAEKIDSDTLMILLLLRKIAKDSEIERDNNHTKIITQVLNSDNQDLILQTDVDDFIISNKLITMILAQLSEQPGIKKLYDDIFQEDGSEIYVKPAHLYFTELPITASFASIMEQARKRDEICLGLRNGNLSKTAEENFGITLNPEKDDEITITANDSLVVLAEDEL